MGKGSHKSTDVSGSGSPAFAGQPIDRREFVVRTSGVLALGAFVSACSDPDAGTVRVTISGLLPGFTSAGSATITGDGLAGPLVIQFPGVATGEARVRAGTYHVVYEPPAGYAMAAGSPNDIEVTVRSGEPTEVEFDVVQASGTLQINVQGLGSSTSGGSAAVQRTDIAGQTSITLPIPAAGSASTSLVPGTYSVTYTPPSGFALNAGQVNPRSLVVTGGQTQSTTFQVTAESVQPPVGIIFHSDFSTALGSGDAAILDTAKSVPWSIRGGAGMEVIASTGLDFPTANVLRVNALTSNSGFAIVRKTGMPVPSVGQSRYYRWYIRAGANIEDSNTHPIQDGQNAGASNWQFEMLHTIGGANKWTVQFKHAAVQQNFLNQNFRGPALDVNVTYRFEVHLQRTSATAYNFHVRVYNSANTLLFSDANFTNVDQGIPHLGAQGTGQFGFGNAANLDGLNGGCNGVAPLSSDRLYSYQGGFAVGGTDWIGPYAGGI